MQIEAKLRSALVERNSEELLSLYDSLDRNIEFQVYSLNASLAHHVASHPVDLLCLRKLVDKFGANCLTCRNSTGETPVHLAARYKDETWMELCRNFLGSECFLAPANSGGTVVHYAATNESSSSSLRWIAKELGKEYFVATDRLGNSAIHYSARYQSLNTLKFLLAKFGWEIFELKNCEDETVVDWIEKDTNTNRRESKQAWIAGRQQPQGAQSLAAQLSTAVAIECPFRERWDPARLIGRGGFGEVHEVLTDRGVTCAAKTLRLPLQLGTEQGLVSNEIERVVSREKNLCQLQHDNIVKFLYIAQTEPATVVVFMELLDGKTLEAFIDKTALDENKIRDFSKQICNALHYMHSRDPSVIHRDLNCANIIVLTNTMLIKLIDFGLSVTLEQSVSHISASSASPKGTLSFMAPELLAPNDSDTPKYSRESDIWAFGCSVFQMATGGRPFAEHKNSWTLPERLRSSGAPALPDGCSAELKDFYRRCTANKCKKRLPAQELMKHEFLTNQRLQSSKRKFGGLFGDRK